MATLLMVSAEDRARADKVQAAIDAGEIRIVARRPGVSYPRPADGIFNKPPFNFTRELDIADQIRVFGFDPRHLLPAPKPEAPVEIETDGYAPSCGLQPKARWAFDFLMLVFEEWVRLEVETANQGYSPDALVRANLEQSGFDAAAHTYLASIGVQRLNASYKSIVPGQMDWFAIAVYDYFARRRYPVKFIVPARPQAAPQLLQSREDVMEQIAMSKAPIDPNKVDEMAEAVRFSVEHWENLDARTLPDGYGLYQSPSKVYIYFKHPAHANRVVVGTTDPVTHLMKFVSKRGEVRSYMLKVKQANEPEEAAA